MQPHGTAKHPRYLHAFTLVELLVVISIIALLIGILLPSLGTAREQARATVCLTNLHGIGQGLVLYSQDNSDYLIPSFNMTGWGAPNTTQTVDGWPAILDRDGLVSGYNGPTNNPYFCPDTLNVEGMAGGQTGTDPNKPKGYQDWPTTYLNGGDSGGQADPGLPIPGGFNHEIRCGYWMNANNPIGGGAALATVTPNVFYTWSVGYTAADGTQMTNQLSSTITNPEALIVVADGVYMGRQTVNQAGMTNSRIGYRHVFSGQVAANTTFADGHAQPLATSEFPLASSSSNVYATVQALNFGLYTVYADPHGSLP